MPTRKLATSLRAALRHLPASDIPLPPVVEINWISAEEMCRVHQEFLADPTLTDVITFHHGEILVCPLVARQEAAKYGHSYQRELLFYALHGLLHLLGWDDETVTGRRKMHQTQSKILRLIEPKN